jgi:hypothetical protein
MQHKYVHVFLASALVVLGALFVLSEVGAENDTNSLASEDLVEMVEEENPGTALKKLKKESRRDPNIAQSCHYYLHPIGRATYNKYQDFNKSWSYADTFCKGGYIHGNLHEYLDERETIPDSFDVCSQFEEESMYQWSCSHGAGNGFLMFTSSNLSKSLDLCESKFKTGFQKKSCANGVYAQHFRDVSSKENSSRYNYPEDAFETCRHTRSEYKGQCYFYASNYLHNDKVGKVSTGLEITEKCLHVRNNSLKKSCLSRLTYVYLLEATFEASKIKARIGILN